jgi:nucleoid DNA-binding protein
MCGGLLCLSVYDHVKEDCPMTKAELVSRVSKQCNITKKVAESVLNSMTGAIRESLKDNEAIRISHLGTFWVLQKKARTGVNPQTKAKIQIPAMKSPRFRAAKALRDAVKADEQEESVDDVRHEVERLCRESDAVSAFFRAMKSYMLAQQEFGKDDPRTAGFMVIVADVAGYREKYHFAEQLYRKALSIYKGAFGLSHPEVVRCERALSLLEQYRKS